MHMHMRTRYLDMMCALHCTDMLHLVGYCLEAAGQEHGALGAARLSSFGNWLGLDDSLERCKLRRKRSDGNEAL